MKQKNKNQSYKQRWLSASLILNSTEHMVLFSRLWLSNRGMDQVTIILVTDVEEGFDILVSLWS